MTTNSEGNFAAEIPSITVNARADRCVQVPLRAGTSVGVTPHVTLLGPAEKSTLLTGRGNAVKFYGSVTPTSPVHVCCSSVRTPSTKASGGRSRSVTSRGGVYAFTHRFWVPGSASLRVVVGAHGRYTTRAISETRVYEVSQGQLPGLTIKSSQQPDIWGTPVTFSGVSSAGEGKTVDLWSRPTRFGHFEKVAETTTGAGGSYSFNHVAKESRLYHATVGLTRSATIAEGVHYGLKLTSTWPTTVASGEKLVVEGETIGAPAGQRVLLERENVFGHTFHVIGESTVNAEGKFKVETVLLGSGLAAVRVKVTGDLGHRAAWSNRAAIELTPAPPTLTLPTPTPVLPIS